MFGYIQDNNITISNPLVVNNIVYSDTHLKGMDKQDREALSIYPVEEVPYDTTKFRHTTYSYNLIGGETILGQPSLFPIPADELKPAKLQAINALRETKLEEPVSFQNNLYDADSKAVLNLTATVASIGVGLMLPETFTWRTHDNINIPFTGDMVKTLGNTMLERNAYIYQVSWLHKSNVEALTTADEVLEYDITQGW